MLCFIERKEDFLNLVKSEVFNPKLHNIVSITPEVIFHANKLNVEVINPESYAPLSQLADIGDKNYNQIEQICSCCDEILKRHIPSARFVRHISFQAFFHDIKCMFDSLTIRFYHIKSIIDKYPEEKIAIAWHNQKPLSDTSLFGKSAYYYTSRICAAICQSKNTKINFFDGHQFLVIEPAKFLLPPFPLFRLQDEHINALKEVVNIIDEWREKDIETLFPGVEYLIFHSTNITSVTEKLATWALTPGRMSINLTELFHAPSGVVQAWNRAVVLIIQELLFAMCNSHELEWLLHMDNVNCFSITREFFELLIKNNLAHIIITVPFLEKNLISLAGKRCTGIIGGVANIHHSLASICSELDIKLTSIHYGAGHALTCWPMHERYDMADVDYFICGGDESRKNLSSPAPQASFPSSRKRAQPLPAGLPWTDSLFHSSRVISPSIPLKKVLIAGIDFYGDNRYLGYVFPEENLFFSQLKQFHETCAVIPHTNFHIKPPIPDRSPGIHNPLYSWLKETAYQNMFFIDPALDFKEILKDYDGVIIFGPWTPLQYALCLKIPILLYCDNFAMLHPNSKAFLSKRAILCLNFDDFKQKLPDFCSGRMLGDFHNTDTLKGFISGGNSGNAAQAVVNHLDSLLKPQTFLFEPTSSIQLSESINHPPCHFEDIKAIRYNIDARKLHKEIQLAWDPERPIYPTQLAIEPYRGCNARCVMCPTDKMSRKTGALKISDLMTILSKIQNWGAPIQLITHAGLGEPMLNKNLSEIINLEKQIFPSAKIIVYSNGGLCTDTKIDALLQSGLDIISFSVNGFYKSTYEETMKIPRDKTYDNINNVLNKIRKSDSNMQVHVSFIKMNNTKEMEILEFKNYWEPRVHSVIFPPYITWGGQFNINVSKYQLPCFYLWKVLMIDYDGVVKMCCEDYDSSFPIGNILSQDPDNIFNSDLMRKQRHRQLTGDFNHPKICKNCVESWETAFDFCKIPEIIIRR